MDDLAQIKRILIYTGIGKVIFVFYFCAALVAAGQNPQPTAQPFTDTKTPLPAQRPNLLRELGLSRDQIQAIRRMNQERRPLMEAATARLRNANRLLDEAIYADELDESLIAARFRDVQAAQAELARLRFDAEVNLRKLLTAEQLARFRDIRRRFAAARPAANQIPEGQPANSPRPLQRPVQRLRPVTGQKPPI